MKHTVSSGWQVAEMTGPWVKERVKAPNFLKKEISSLKSVWHPYRTGQCSGYRNRIQWNKVRLIGSQGILFCMLFHHWCYSSSAVELTNQQAALLRCFQWSLSMASENYFSLALQCFPGALSVVVIVCSLSAQPFKMQYALIAFLWFSVPSLDIHRLRRQQENTTARSTKQDL